MKWITVLLLIWGLVVPVKVAATSEAYTLYLDNEGDARVFVRVEGVQIGVEGGIFSYKLPNRTETPLNARYKDNGCERDDRDICIRNDFFGKWKNTEFIIDQDELKVMIPPRKVSEPDIPIGIDVGLDYSQKSVITRQWWGSVVDINLGTNTDVVKDRRIGVYLPSDHYPISFGLNKNSWRELIYAIGQVSKGEESSSSVYDGALATDLLDMTGNGLITKVETSLEEGSSITWRVYAFHTLFAWLLLVGLIALTIISVIVGLIYLIQNKHKSKYGNVV